MERRNLNDYTVAELKIKALSKGIKIKSNMRKADIIAAIRAKYHSKKNMNKMTVMKGGASEPNLLHVSSEMKVMPIPSSMAPSAPATAMSLSTTISPSSAAMSPSSTAMSPSSATMAPMSSSSSAMSPSSSMTQYGGRKLLDKYTVIELKEKAKKLGIIIKSNMTKNKIIAAIRKKQ